MLTGRYQLKRGFMGCNWLYPPEAMYLAIEAITVRGEFIWRHARPADLKALEPFVRDGWRFPEERNGLLGHDGARYRE